MQERTGALLFFSINLGILFFIQLVGATVILIWGVEESPILTKELNEVFLKLVYNWDIDPRASRILKQIQEYVRIDPLGLVQNDLHDLNYSNRFNNFRHFE